jgi:2,5-diamino-6-(ribosylamino)-4(3H)-pyrimidinone 5'-phosphate reductase
LDCFLHEMNRPRVIINVAMTADGKIDSTARKGAVISSDTDKTRVDCLRASVDAILVGGRTLLDEDPKLTVKSADLRASRICQGLPENPAKIGIVSDLNSIQAALVSSQNGLPHGLPLQSFLFSGPARVFLFTSRLTAAEVIKTLETSGATVIIMGEKRVDLLGVFRYLYKTGIHSVLVEGGGTINAELLRLRLVDELIIYMAAKIFSGDTAPSLADGPGFKPDQAIGLRLQSVEKFDPEGGILIHYIIDHKE